MGSVLSKNKKAVNPPTKEAYGAGNKAISTTTTMEKRLSDIQFGWEMRAKFPFDEKWTNMNNGSFGSIPTSIFNRLHHYSLQSELRPDHFIRYQYPHLLLESRKALADLVNAPLETVVLVSNATEAVNTVFRNIKWNEDGKDVVIMFDTVYEGCGKTVDFVVDYFAEDQPKDQSGILVGARGRVSSVEIPLTYPEEDGAILDKFKAKVKDIEASGKRARLALFDVVSSRPGVKFPWVQMIALCKQLGVFSLVDGAQGVGMIPLDLSAADPDVFLSNCHKWLHVPRGCALFYVPIKNQYLFPSTLATSHGYVPKTKVRTTPLPDGPNLTPFEKNFGFVGTIDNSPYLCVKDSIQWRKDIGGEKKILDYLWSLSKKGGQLVAERLGTFVLDNKTGTLTDCAMCNVALPLWIGERGDGAKEEDVVLPQEEADEAFQWMLKTMNEEYNTFIALFAYRGRLWTRLSAQVYLGLEDYEFAAKTLKSLGDRAGRGEYRSESSS